MAQTFPKWANVLPPLMGAGAAGGGVVALIVVYFFFSPSYTDVGYQPEQPVPYSHALHVGELGLDCRYCHVGVESNPHALVPAAETCMNCHLTNVKTDSALLAPVRESFNHDKPVEWVRVHDLPDYVYFDHSRHVNSGVGCVSCHGRIDQMEVVRQAEPLSMGWCLECHRQPEKHLRPLDKITDMTWKAENQMELGAKLKVERRINPPEHCSGCHR